MEMQDNSPRDNSPHENSATPGDLNVEKLVRHSYRPEPVPEGLVDRVESAMLKAAAERGDSPNSGPIAPNPTRIRSWWSRPAVNVGMSIAAMLILAASLWMALHGGGNDPTRQPANPLASSHNPNSPTTVPDERANRPTSRQIATAPKTPAPLGPMVAKSLEPAAIERAQSGQTIKTSLGQKRRLTLEDGSVLYINQESVVTIDSPRQISITRGDAFVEVAPADGKQFTVHTPGREIVALGTRFGVNVKDQSTGVLVTQGKVRVSGIEQVLPAGSELRHSGQIVAAPRASSELEWMSDLVEAGQARLIPVSAYSGGALTVKDASGQESRLELRKFHVDVYIEDGFARTTIDQTYFNHQPSRMEGTFYFPLPADAGLSRLAMYVDGKLMEGGMAERETARAVYESIVHARRDPALLEWVDGTTFKMRVFPLEGLQEKRIVLSYVQRLAPLYGRTTYRFPQGHSLGQVSQWSFHALVKGGAQLGWNSTSHALRDARANGDLVLDASLAGVKPEQDVVLTFSQITAPVSARFVTQDFEKSKYLMLRWRPDLQTHEQKQRRDWVFIHESSAARDPVLARAQIEIIRTILNNAEHDDTVAVVSAAARPTTLWNHRRPATAQNIAEAIKFLETRQLIGALDLSKSLDAAGKLTEGAANPWIVHVGSGLDVIGPRNDEHLLQRITPGAKYVGIGVGKRWSRQFMKAAASKTGGYFAQINPDENIAWRAFDVLATLNTPRLLDVKVVDPAEKVQFLSESDSLAQGEELCAAARIENGAAMPQSLIISGMLDGKSWKREIKVQSRMPNAGYLARFWAKLEIDRLVAAGAHANRPRIIELSKQMYVMSPFTSLLVLENDAMYQQYNIDRGRKDHWALYPCPERIDVVTEKAPPVAQAPATTQPTTRPAEEIARENRRDAIVRCLESILVRGTRWAIVQPGQTNPTPTLTAHALLTGAWAVPLVVYDTNGDGVVNLHYTTGNGTLYYGGQNFWGYSDRLDLGSTGVWMNSSSFTPAPFLDGHVASLGTGGTLTFDTWTSPRIYNGTGIIINGGDFNGRIPHYWMRGANGFRLVDGTAISSSDFATFNGIISGSGTIRIDGTPGWSGDSVLIPSTHWKWGDEPWTLADYAQAGYYTWSQNGTLAMGRGQRPSLVVIRDGDAMQVPMLTPAREIDQLVNQTQFESARMSPTQWVKATTGPNGHAPVMIRIRQEEVKYRFDEEIRKAEAAIEARKWTDVRSAIENARVAYQTNMSLYNTADVESFEKRVRDTTTSMATAQAQAERAQTTSAKSEQNSESMRREESVVDRRQLISSLIDRAQDRIRHRNYRNAIDVLDQILALEPNNDYARGARPLVQDSLQFQDSRRNVMWNSGFSGPFNSAQERKIPYEDILRYPEHWPDISELRDAEILREGNRSIYSEDLAVRAQLDRRVPEISFAGQPLADVIEFLRDVSGSNIFVNWRVLESVGIKRDTPVTLKARDERFARVLELLLDQVGAGKTKLAYEIDEGSVVISTESALGLRPWHAWTTMNYVRPTPAVDATLFTDLLSFAPGMNTAAADVAAAIDREAPTTTTPGKIDPAAKQLVDRARRSGWVQIKLPAGTARIDGAGRFITDTRTVDGLREIVACDGRNLFHLYPEIGIGAKRAMTRFHRAQQLGGIPWFIPPAEDLALAANIVSVSADTIALEPRFSAATRPASWRRIELRFAAGELAQRALVEMPARKIICRQNYSPDGTIVTFDSESREIARRKIDVGPCATPNLMPDDGLVILPMPWRTRDYVMSQHNLKAGEYDKWSADDKLAMLAAEMYGGNPHVLVSDAFAKSGDKRLGLYVLAVSAGCSMEIPASTAPSPLERYLARATRALTGDHTNAWPAIEGDHFLARLATLAEIHDTLNIVSQPIWDQHIRDTLRSKWAAVLKQYPGSELAWSLALRLRDRLKSGPEIDAILTNAVEPLSRIPSLSYQARYEAARSLVQSGQTDKARKIFAELYSQAIDQGVIPGMDEDFYRAFTISSGSISPTTAPATSPATSPSRTASAVIAADEFTELMRDTSARLAKRCGPVAAIEQAIQLRPRSAQLANELFEQAIRSLDEQASPTMRLAAVRYLYDAQDYARAQELLEPLLAAPGAARTPGLWRLASHLADRRGNAARAAQCLERAVEIELAALPETVDVSFVRRPCSDLLARYETIAGALATLGQTPSSDLTAKVLGVADRWRQLDPDPTQPCHAAARVFKKLGLDDLAWDYLTTPLAQKNSEAQPWQALATQLVQQGDIALADRAYATAFEVEPTNAQALWDRAEFLRNNGRIPESRDLYQKLVAGTWESRWDNLKRQAAERLGQMQ